MGGTWRASPPGYEQLEIDHELLAGGLVPVAAGMPKHDGQTAIRIRNRHAALYGARLQPGGHVQMPDALNRVRYHDFAVDTLYPSTMTCGVPEGSAFDCQETTMRRVSPGSSHM